MCVCVRALLPLADTDMYVCLFDRSAVTCLHWLPVVPTQTHHSSTADSSGSGSDTAGTDPCIICGTADGSLVIASCGGAVVSCTHTDSPLRCLSVIRLPPPSLEGHQGGVSTSAVCTTTALAAYTLLAVCGCQNGNIIIYTINSVRSSYVPPEGGGMGGASGGSVSDPTISSSSAAAVLVGSYSLNHLHTLMGAHARAVTAISSTGTALVTGSEEGVLRVWNFISNVITTP